MDVEKLIKRTEFKLFGKTIFEIVTRLESNLHMGVTPIAPIIEISLDDTNNNN